MCAARAARMMVVPALVAGAMVAGGQQGDAHKPILSPFTYNEHVFPVLRDRCGQCHVDGGVAPMSLMTHADAVPWAESMRIELMAGHMPPWRIDSPPGRFRNAAGLSGRELDVLLTWAAGGTPIGPIEKPPQALEPGRRWPLGTPDLVLPLPSEVTLSPETRESTVEFTIATGTTEPRWVRAVDLAPGTPAIVRGASIRARPLEPDAPHGTLVREPVLAAWVPGDAPVPLPEGGGFHLPAGAELSVRLHYRKTWEHERLEMTDRSTIGLYFASPPARDVLALVLAPFSFETLPGSRVLSFTRTIREDVRAVAIYPDAALAGAGVKVEAALPDGSRDTLIALRPHTGWTRRYWFREPVSLPRGTRIDVVATFDDGRALLPPGALPPPATPPDLASLRVTINVVAEAPAGR